MLKFLSEIEQRTLNLHTADNPLLGQLDFLHLNIANFRAVSSGYRISVCVFRLSSCLITETGCVFLASALSANSFHLRELDLRFNYPGDSGTMLQSAGGALETFRYGGA